MPVVFSGDKNNNEREKNVRLYWMISGIRACILRFKYAKRRQNVWRVCVFVAVCKR